MATSYGKAALGNLLEWRIERFGGLDYNPDASQIADNRSPDMQNLLIDAHGGLRKRQGWKKLLAQPAPGGGIGLIRHYPKIDKLVFAAGRNLYAWAEGDEPLWIGELDAPPTDAFVMNDKLWLLDGSTYWCYDGTNLSPAMENAYVPLVYRNVDGPVTAEFKHEDYNMLSTHFCVQYSPDGSRTRFWLPQFLDYWYVYRISILGEIQHGFVFNAHPSSPYVELPQAPEAGLNTLEIELVLKEQGENDKRRRINHCRIAGVFGGDNDTRIFLSGNPDKPSTDWHSGLYDPTYFPEQQYSQVGWSDDAIVAYSLQYDTMIIHKQKSTWSRQFEIESGRGIFPVKPVNDQVGLLAPGSVQLIDNCPAVLTESGVYCLTGGQVRDERNMKHISALVDRRLLRETSLAQAAAFDFEGRYGLALDGSVYVYDYRNGEWLYWENVPAAVFFVHAGKLYFGQPNEGMICRFCLEDEEDVLQDDGRPIAAYWRSKSSDLGAATVRKLVRRVYLTFGMKAAKNSAALFYATDSLTLTELPGCSWRQFFFEDLDFSEFSFLLSDLPQTFARKVQARRLFYFCLRLENEELGEDMAIARLAVDYQLDKEKVR